MREILFRGFHPDKNGEEEVFVNGEWINGYWVYGDLIHRRIWKSDFLVIREDDSGFDNYTDYEIIPETVGQYTGIKDDNEKKIFENDFITYKIYGASIVSVVKIGEYEQDGSGGEYSPTMCYGVYAEIVGNTAELTDYEKEYLKTESLLRYTEYHHSGNTSIIGNIFENPELLKGEKNAD